MMNPRQIEAIARLVATLRSDWDVRGIEAALGKVDANKTATETALAAIKAAADPANRTPRVIAFAGTHWGDPRGRSKAPEHWQPPRPCPSCNNVHNPGAPCGRRDPNVATRGAAIVRAAMRGQLDPDQLEETP